MIKTFRGQLADNTIRKIRLSTNDGLTGYKIIKFQAMPASDNSIEAALQLYSVEPESAEKDITFENPTLLGAIYFSMNDNSGPYPEDQTVVFDNTVINQDIFITLKCHNDISNLNYYIELEQFKLDLSEATVATLKDMRGRE
jgi:hypothetical protein